MKTPAKFHILTLSFLTIALTLGCISQYAPYAHLYSTEKPKTGDIVGLYNLKEQTIIDGNLDFIQGKPSTIKINIDGSYKATNFPNWMEREEANNNHPKLISETGTWRIDEIGSISSKDGTINVWGIRFSGIETANLTKNTPPHGLIFSYGDPDSGDVMIYEKIE